MIKTDQDEKERLEARQRFEDRSDQIMKSEKYKAFSQKDKNHILEFIKIIRNNHDQTTQFYKDILKNLNYYFDNDFKVSKKNTFFLH